MLDTLLVQYNPDGSIIYDNNIILSAGSSGRLPFSYVELDLDYCTNMFGTSPCTATDSGDAKCFNTFATCKDTANFSRATRTYRFCSTSGGKVPVGLDAIPCLVGINITPAVIDAGKGLGLRASCEITLRDFPHSDIRIDLYVDGRTYIPINQGSFFGKFKARNPYYNGRVMRVYSGYLADDGSFDILNFEKRTYFLDGFDGIDANGIVKITAKDILKLAGDDRSVCPKPSVGKINADINNSATTATLTPTGVGALDYPASGYIRIGSEVCSFTRSGDVLTIARGKKGTSAVEHKLGDTVQLCKEISGETVQNIVYDLLVNFCGVYSGYLDLINWNAEQTAYLTRLYSALITAPTGVSKLLTELCEQVGILLFWDEVKEKLILKSVRPNSLSETVTDLTADYHLLADSLKLKDLNDERVNEAWIYYGLIDFTKNLEEEANYKLLYVAANVSDQSTNKNRDVRIKKIFSRWITETASNAATELAQKYLERYAVAPIEANFNLDAKDGSLALADFVRINSRQYQDFYGNNQDLLLQIVKRKEALVGTTWAFTARQFAFSSNANPDRLVDIAVDTLDLDLKAAHDEQYAPARSGDVVTITIKSGVLVTASSTSLYALTNPSTWASGVIVKLVIESGAIVAGRGGDGGRGGKVVVLDSGGSPVASPTMTDGFDGLNGGRALLISYPLSIVNNGVITVGGGGGGGSGAGWGSYFGARAQSGNGGGGGWPFGAAGAAGQIAYDDSSQADFSYSDGYTCYSHSGNFGYMSTSSAAQAHGGAYRLNQADPYFGDGWASSDAGGDGGNTLITQASDGGGSATAFGNMPLTTSGGDGGDAGDYYLVGNSYVTWIATGTRYGAIV